LPERPSLSLWLAAPVPSRLQNSLEIGERKGARAGLPKGAVWRSLIFPAMFSDDVSKDGKAAWKRAWLATDERGCIDGPVQLELDVYRTRPGAHYRADGTLSPEGLRRPVPATKPDLSNYLKLAEDALKGLAFGDDALVVEVRVAKHWVLPGEQPGARLVIRSAVPADTLQQTLPI
jgi:Holliday junction resolvase RusA-like endonuclease